MTGSLEARRGGTFGASSSSQASFATHDRAGLTPRPEQGFDPGDYYRPADIARLLGPDWTVLVDEIRPRPTPAPAGTHHTHDAVLRARRPGRSGPPTGLSHVLGR
ncbi:hypothetical protein ACJ6WF_06235 [Streptomyces sp. MMS24-I2-30]|uniref:hypothetical protein n=1 Tax=Streptomyces sp. MMS24-I2-30 TaxID=3351564 RepID=UPI00389692B3